MKIIFTASVFLILHALAFDAAAQKRTPVRALRSAAASAQPKGEVGATAVVIDETLSVLRARPSLFAEPLQRMRRGRTVKILSSAAADGVKFYRVAAPPAGSGWVQSDALFGRFRAGDPERLARLIQAGDGFDQIELAHSFSEIFPDSPLRPAIMLLLGDLLEQTAAKLSRDAAGRLDRREMAATGAPMHSYYLNFVMLDRYRKLGIVFLFDPPSRAFHYDGASWKEIIAKFPASPEAAEAKSRLESLTLKMEKK